MSNNSSFAPFKSGCGMCKPSSDYTQPLMHGSGNYSKDGLIPQSNGKNYYQETNYELETGKNFDKNNYGIDYSTAHGG